MFGGILFVNVSKWVFTGKTAIFAGFKPGEIQSPKQYETKMSKRDIPFSCSHGHENRSSPGLYRKVSVEHTFIEILFRRKHK